MNTKFLMTTAVSGLALAASSAQAALITETFSGLAGTNLVGTTTPDGNNWIGASNTNFKANGSQPTTNGNGSAYLGFTLTQGLIYTLQVDLNPAEANSTQDWLAMGFSTATGNGSTAAHLQTNTYAWLLYRDNGNAQSFTGVGGTTNGGVAHTAPTGKTFRIELDTSNALDYTAEFFDGSGSLRGPVSIGAPALNNIWISSLGVGGSFDNLTLTATPEPGSLALLGVGGLLIASRRRRG